MSHPTAHPPITSDLPPVDPPAPTHLLIGALPASPISDSAAHPAAPAGAPADLPPAAITVTRCLIEQAAQLEPVALSQQQLNALSALLQHAPSLALNTAMLLERTYVLRFAPQVTARLATGTATIMRSLEGGIRATAINGSGQIIGQGSLVAASGLHVATTALVVWQLLAMVTAQQYLRDIERRLLQIETSLDAIRRWLEDRELATLMHSFAYLRNFGEVVRDRCLTAADMETFNRKIEPIEEIERECGQVQVTFQLAMQRSAERFRTQPLGNMFWGAVEKNVAAAIEVVGEYEGYARAALLAIAAQTTAVAVRTALPQSPADLAISLHRLQHFAGELQDWQQAQRQFGSLVSERVAEVQAKSDVRGALSNRRAQLQSAADVSRARLAAGHAQLVSALADTIQHVEAQIAAAEQPLELVVELDAAGQVIRVARPRQERGSLASLPAPTGNLPAAAEVIAQITARLRAVPGMMDASWDDFRHAQVALLLSNRVDVRIWTSPLGVEHVFVGDPLGNCVYAGFVAWMHAAGLRTALSELAATCGDLVVSAEMAPEPVPVRLPRLPRPGLPRRRRRE